MFDKATRLKLRFKSKQGLISTEDLWDCTLLTLNDIAKTVSKELKEDSEEDFISQKTKTNTELTLKLDVVKHIIEVKLAEKAAAVDRAKRSEELQTLKALVQAKEMKKLEDMDIESLTKRIAELEG